MMMNSPDGFEVSERVAAFFKLEIFVAQLHISIVEAGKGRSLTVGGICFGLSLF